MSSDTVHEHQNKTNVTRQLLVIDQVNMIRNMNNEQYYKKYSTVTVGHKGTRTMNMIRNKTKVTRQLLVIDQVQVNPINCT